MEYLSYSISASAENNLDLNQFVYPNNPLSIRNGGDTVLYHVLDRQTGADCIAKHTILRNLHDIEVKQAEFQAQRLASFLSPFVARVYGYTQITQENSQFGVFVMEMCSNKANLATHPLYKRNIQSYKPYCDFVLQLASAVDIHAQHDLFQNDLTPDNLFFDEKHNLRIIDYGVSNLVVKHTGSVSGSIKYVAPERYCECKNGSLSCEIYSIGQVLYEQLTGRTVLDYQVEAKDTQIGIKNSLVALPENLVPVFSKVFEQLPNKRFVTATAFAEAFVNAVR